MTRQRERARYRQDGGRKKAAVTAWRASNPEKRKEIDRRHYQKNADRKRALAADWAAKNSDRCKANMRRWYRERRRLNPHYRLRAAMSAYVYWCLKGGKEGRSVEAVLGYSMDQLRRHLERQFAAGMTWANYGEWHVDHIVPVSSFDFSDAFDPGFQACWALTNLRPLWAADNIRKSDKRIYLI